MVGLERRILLILVDKQNKQKKYVEWILVCDMLDVG